MVFSLVMIIALPVLALTDDILLCINGEYIQPEHGVKMINNRTMLPMRALFEYLGADVSWNNDTRTAIGKLDNNTVEFTIGKNVYIKNGQEYKTDVPAKLIDANTYLPVRAVAEALGYNVEWDKDTKTVHIAEGEIKKDVIKVAGEEIKVSYKPMINPTMRVFNILKNMGGETEEKHLWACDSVGIDYYAKGKPDVKLLHKFQYSIGYHAQYVKDEYNYQYHVNINEFDEQSLKALEEVLKVFFPNNYKKVYDAALDANTNKTALGDRYGKEVVDGRNVFVRYVDVLGGEVEITIGR